MEFSVRPEPRKEEDIYGYLLRVMNLNGVTTPSSLKSDELSLSNLQSNFGSWSEKDLKQHLNGLSKLTGQAKYRLNHLWQKAHPTWTFNPQRAIQSLKTTTPRCCLSCLSESLSFNKDWSNVTFTACDLHNEKLIYKCTECSTPFTWNTAIFEGCPACATEWTSLDPDERSLKPCIAEKKFKSLNEHEKNKASDSFAKCLIRALRPFDIEPFQLSKVPVSSITSEVIRNGYQLWTNSVAREEHRRNFEKHWISISPLVAKLYQEIEIPFLYRRDINELIYSYESTGIETDKALKPAIQKLVTKDQPSHTIVTPIIFAKALEINKLDLPSLSKCNLIKTIRKTTVVRDTLYDIRSAEKLINSISILSESTSKDLIEVRPGDSVFERHLTKFGALIADIILGDIAGYRCSDSIRCIVLDRNEFYNWLSEQLKTNCQGKLSVSRAKKIGGRLFNDNPLERMILNGEIKFTKTQKNKIEIDGASLYEFITSR